MSMVTVLTVGAMSFVLLVPTLMVAVLVSAVSRRPGNAPALVGSAACACGDPDCAGHLGRALGDAA
jgi:hypothetical protein